MDRFLWGIGIEHEVMLLHPPHDKEYIKGKKLKRNLRLDEHSNRDGVLSKYAPKYRESIIRSIYDEGSYPIVHAYPANKLLHADAQESMSTVLRTIIDAILPSHHWHELTSYARNTNPITQEDVLTDLVYRYCSLIYREDTILLHLDWHDSVEYVVNLFQQALHEDSTLHHMIPEFITPYQFYASKPIKVICEELDLKQRIYQAYQNMIGKPFHFTSLGYAFPLYNTHTGRAQDIDYTGSYHINLTLPYPHNQVYEEKMYYAKNCDFFSRRIDRFFSRNIEQSADKQMHPYMDVYSRVLQTKFHRLLRIMGGHHHVQKFHSGSIRVLEKQYEDVTRFFVDHQHTFKDIIGSSPRCGGAPFYRSGGGIFQHLYMCIQHNRCTFYVRFGDKCFAIGNTIVKFDQLVQDLLEANQKLYYEYAVLIRFRYTASGDTDSPHDCRIQPEASYLLDRNVMVYVGRDMDKPVDLDHYFRHDTLNQSGAWGPEWKTPLARSTRDILNRFFQNKSPDDATQIETFANHAGMAAAAVIYHALKSPVKALFDPLDQPYNDWIKYNKSDFHRHHHQWAIAIQWFAPLLMSAFCSCDPFSIGDHNQLTELSFRTFVSGYNFINFTNIKDLGIPTSRYLKDTHDPTSLEKKVLKKFKYYYTRRADALRESNPEAYDYWSQRMMATAEFRRDPTRDFDFGFEIRLFDNFPTEDLPTLIEFLFLLAQHIHEKDPTTGSSIGLVDRNPFGDRQFDAIIFDILAQGWNQPLSKKYEEIIEKLFHLKISLACKASRGGSQPYVFDVINDYYAQLQLKYREDIMNDPSHVSSRVPQSKYQAYALFVIQRDEPTFTVKQFTNLNRRSWTHAFESLHWNVHGAHSPMKRLIQPILDDAQSRKKYDIQLLRKKLNDALGKDYTMDIDDVLYALDDLQVVSLRQFSNVFTYKDEARMGRMTQPRKSRGPKK